MKRANLRPCKEGDQIYDLLWFWCPGCNEYHAVKVNIPNGWQWNGSEESPTLSPSIKVSGYRKQYGPGERTLCHSYVENGKIRFLSDCAHSLAGQTVDLPEADRDKIKGAGKRC